MKRLFMVMVTLVGAICLAAAGAQAAMFTNGGFETGTAPGSSLMLTATDTTNLTPWVVSAGSIDYIGTYWTPTEGSRSLDLIGLDLTGTRRLAGTIYQTFDTAPGKA